MGLFRVVKIIAGLIAAWFIFWWGLLAIIVIVGFNEVGKDGWKKKREPTTTEQSI